MILPGRPRLTLAAVPGSVFRRPDRRRTLRAEPHSNALIAVASRRAGIRMRALRTGDSIMFENLMATAVLPASDLDRARRWWHDVLDRDPVHTEDEMGNLFYNIGGMMVLVYRTDFAGTAENTTLNLLTDDLDRDAPALRERGVVFHDYDLPGLKTVDGIAEMDGLRSAWFSDSEGNIIAIGEPTDEMMRMMKRTTGTVG